MLRLELVSVEQHLIWKLIERGTTSGGSIVTGVTSGTVVTYTGTSYSDIEDRVVATLRSRGSVNSQEEMEFDVTASTSVNICWDYCR